MQIITDYKKCPENAFGSVIALGNFDGVHKGHQAIIAQTIAIADNIGAPSALMTFEPHPVSFFKPGTDNFRLTDADKKASLLESAGIDNLFSIAFDKEFAQITAQDFISEILVKHLKVCHVVIGYDFIFGHKRGGNADLLKQMSEKFGYGFTKISAVGAKDVVFSSTKIRDYIRNGNLKKAADILGRIFSVQGKVVRGDNRGKSIGFPTINVESGEYIRPKTGVYAVIVDIEGKKYKAVANIGTKPTFDGENETLEVHIFDFDRNIYSTKVGVGFVDYIRDEQKFDGIDSLVAQIKNDSIKAKEILA